MGVLHCVLQHQDTMKLFLGISCSAIAAANAWTYSAVADWANVSATCASSVPNQSPINVYTGTVGTTTDPLQFQGLPDSAINPAIRQSLVINNHTWEVNWDIDGAAVDKYGVVYNNKVFKLDQFHFHSPSEHTLDNNHYDLEAHLVHSCYGVNCVTEAEGDENLVVAIFMNVGAENPYLATFWPDLAALAANSSAPYIVDDMANPYNNFVPPAPHDFYRYIGSTTTPDCVANVEWFLMSTPATLSQAQLTSYRTAITNHNYTQTTISNAVPTGVTATWAPALGTNNRPLQVVGNRVPQKYMDPAEIAELNTEFMWHGVLIFLGAVALALCCLFAYSQLTKPKPKKGPTNRGISKPKPKPKPAEEVPLVAPPLPVPLAPVPPLFTNLQVPMTYASPVQLQAPQMTQIQAVQTPLMMAP